MNATDVVGYTYDGEFYCTGNDCLPDGVRQDSEEVTAVFVDSEWDYYPVCGGCGEQCEDISLTTEGEQGM